MELSVMSPVLNQMGLEEALKYLNQLTLIILFSFLGEVCRWVIPLPVPASIYAMVFLFLALLTKIIPEKQLAASGDFLVSLLPLLFVAPAVNLQASWDLIRGALWRILAVIIVSAVLTFVASGLVTQWILRLKKEAHHE